MELFVEERRLAELGSGDRVESFAEKGRHAELCAKRTELIAEEGRVELLAELGLGMVEMATVEGGVELLAELRGNRVKKVAAEEWRVAELGGDKVEELFAKVGRSGLLSTSIVLLQVTKVIIFKVKLVITSWHQWLIKIFRVYFQFHLIQHLFNCHQSSSLHHH